MAEARPRVGRKCNVITAKRCIGSVNSDAKAPPQRGCCAAEVSHIANRCVMQLDKQRPYRRVAGGGVFNTLLPTASPRTIRRDERHGIVDTLRIRELT